MIRLREVRNSIELRQIGVLDEAKMLAGTGHCADPSSAAIFWTSSARFHKDGKTSPYR